MFSCDHLHHPFQNDPGTSQDDRIPAHLLDGSTPIDGRQVSDLLNYFTALSGQINFYRDDLSVSDWSPFFKKNLPFLLSSISVYPGEQAKSKMASYIVQFQKHPDPDGLRLIFLQAYYATIYPLHQWSGLLSGSGLDLESTLDTLIQDRLAQPIKTLISWMNTAGKCFGIRPPDVRALLANPLWQLTEKDLVAYHPEFSCVMRSRRSQLLALQSTVSGLVNGFTEVAQLASQGAADSVNQDLYGLLLSSGRQDTLPHLALLFSFLKQYGHVMEDLNGLTQKHLDFFFQKVLRLSPGGLVPDKAYIIFGIQKQVPRYTLPAGTLLKDGKDSLQADVFFGLENPVTITQTQVAGIRTVFVNRKEWGGRHYTEGVYMAPDATMADGISMAFKDPANAAWPSLGSKQSQYTPPLATGPVDYPMARLGFILASKILFMNEGKRTVHVQLACQWNDLCNDGFSFTDLFEKARDAVCAKYLVITGDLLGKASAMGVRDQTVKDLTRHYLLDPCKAPLCGQDIAYYRDQALVQIPCCAAQQKDPNRWNDDEALKTKPEKQPVRSEKKKAAGNDPTKGKECADEEQEAICQREEEAFWKKEMGQFTGIEPWEVDILRQLFIPQRVFNILFSGEKGWIVPEDLEMELVMTDPTNRNFLWQIRARIGAGQPAVSFYDKGQLGEDFKVTDPLVKIQLNDAIKWDLQALASSFSQGASSTQSAGCLLQRTDPCGQQVSLYEFFRNIVLLQTLGSQPTKIHITVCGVTSLVVQNDDNLLDGNKAFAPFGMKPAIVDFDVFPLVKPVPEANLNLVGPSFYIGSREVFLKKWDSLFININWLGKPSNFDIYYSNYLVAEEGDLSLEDPGYQVNLALLKDGNWYQEAASLLTISTQLTETVHDNNRLLFDKDKGYNSFESCCHNDFQYSYPVTPNFLTLPPLEYDQAFAPVSQYNAGTKNGFIRMTLEYQDFLHKIYPWILSSQLIAHGKGSAEYILFSRKTASTVAPNEPWTPIIQKGMSIDYKATATVEDIQLIRLYPFAGTYDNADIAGEPVLFPLFCDEGNLFIGLSGLVPGESLNILFQLAEATADTEGVPGILSWQYLTGNVWKDLRPGFEILQEDTHGLTTTGIVQILFPDDIGNKNTVMPSGLYWIRAVLTENTPALSKTIGIYPQAGLVSFVNKPGLNDPQRPATPLPKEKITKLFLPDANVTKVFQPFDSFGGQAPEASGSAYYLRVSERLRHKGRAIQKWDYERMVLQQFPGLLRIKCINHNYSMDSHAYRQDFPMSPGNVLLAVLPDTSQLKVADSLRPTVPMGMLTAIGDYLAPRISPFIHLFVKNPRYEPVDICLDVILRKGKEPSIYTVQLQQDIQGFLTPWLNGNMRNFQFAQRLYLSDLIGFVESRNYIGSLQGLDMCHQGDPMPVDAPAYIDPLTPRSILVAGRIEVTAEEDGNSFFFWKKRLIK